jgi:hypothetical protein
MAAPKELMVLESTDNKELVSQPGRLMRRTIFDMTEMEFNRLTILSKMYAESSFNKSAKKQADYFLIMMKGVELGFSPMAAVGMISIIQGIPALDGKGILAIVYASGMAKDVKIESSETACTVTMIRRDMPSPFVFTFTLKDAEAMSLVNKDGSNYKKQPKVMLKWRAVSNCAREAFPDLLGGLYSMEELAPDNVIVSDDGTMEYVERLALPSGTPAPVPAVDENEQKLNHWIEQLKNLVAPMYKNEHHLQNGIDPGRTIDVAAASLLKHRMISEWGYEETEIGLAIHEALGVTLKEYLAANPRDYTGVWEKVMAFSNAQMNSDS